MLPILTAFTVPQLLRSLGRNACRMSTAAKPVIKASGHPPFANPYAAAPALTEAEKSVIRSTVPVLAEHGLTLTKMFYQRVFSKHPELKNYFNQAHQRTEMQPKALAAAVYAYAANIDNLVPVLPAVRLMAHKHASLSILPAQYPVVGTNLLATLEELLLSAKFPADTVKAVISAWAVAYGQLANILISEEEKLYKAAESVQGGWRGWRNFIVDERVVECNGAQSNQSITTFYLRPQDGAPVPFYLPGQYATVRVMVKDGNEEYFQPRQYSLSGVPDGKRFRISVKREDSINTAAVAPAPHPMPTGASASKCPFMSRPAGIVSNLLHANFPVGSVIEVAPPFGDFTLESMAPAALAKPAQTPLVLIAAGVGITPVVPMLDTALASGRPASLLYGCVSSDSMPMRSWLTSLRSNSAVQTQYYLSNPLPGDRKGQLFDVAAQMDLTKADAKLLHLDNPATQFFVCGPPSFMSDLSKQLESRGVSADRIHTEMFGSGSH